jgi:hypothetical protein
VRGSLVASCGRYHNVHRIELDTPNGPAHVARMTGRPKRNRAATARSEKPSARNANGRARTGLAKAIAFVFAAGVYTKEELQTAVCTYVAEMKQSGATGEGVVRAAQTLVREVGTRFPASDRTQILLADMVTWCLAEYYRESA